MELEERLGELGYGVVGPVATPEAALAAVAADKPHAALLDANLGDAGSSIALAATLVGQGVKIAFCTGYDAIKGLPPELAAAPLLVKPYTDADLAGALKTLLS